MLFLLFITLILCITYPLVAIPILSPFIIMLLAIGVHAIKDKIRTGYFNPTAHREELKKKGIEV